MSTTTITLTMSGTVNGVTVSETASCVVSTNKAVTQTRDLSNSDIEIGPGGFAVAMVMNIGDDAICVRVNNINFAIPVGKMAVFPGTVGVEDGATSAITTNASGTLRLRSLTSAGTRARITTAY